MNYQEAQRRPDENVTYPSEPSMGSQKPKTKEPVTQIQRDSVITREDVPNPLFRFTSSLIFLLPILFVAGVYYGIINP